MIILFNMLQRLCGTSNVLPMKRNRRPRCQSSTTTTYLCPSIWRGQGFGAQSLSCSKTCDPDWLLSLRMTGGRRGYMAWWWQAEGGRGRGETQADWWRRGQRAKRDYGICISTKRGHRENKCFLNHQFCWGQRGKNNRQLELKIYFAT